jgi:hypothetical protein
VQSGHFGWSSIAAEVAQLDRRYARTQVTKPVVEGEIGYERFGGTHLEDFQRTAFWLAMLNGAAGHTYGADGTHEAYGANMPLHRIRWSFRSWQEGMNLPGSTQVGLGANLLRRFEWWRFEPHPEWVTPRGTTLLEPRSANYGWDYQYSDVFDVPSLMGSDPAQFNDRLEADYPGGEWKARHGNFRRPYAAGIPGQVRILYLPNIELVRRVPPTVLGLEAGVSYQGYFWEPSMGMRVDLGRVARPAPGTLIRRDNLKKRWGSQWTQARREGEVFEILKSAIETDAQTTVQVRGESRAGLLLRYRDETHHVAAIYSAAEKALYLIEREGDREERKLGSTPVEILGQNITLRAEVRGTMGIASITDGSTTLTTPIVDLSDAHAGRVGLLLSVENTESQYADFELRRSPTLSSDEPMQSTLRDAWGQLRGELSSPGWEGFGRQQNILLDAYRPERLPSSGDWLLVLKADGARFRRNQ